MIDRIAIVFSRLCAASLPALLLGCATGGAPLPTSVFGGEQRWTTADLVNVALSEADRNRAEPWYGLLGKGPRLLLTGSDWQQVFVGDLAKSPTFTIESTRLDSKAAAAGFATRAHYRIQGTLHLSGKDYPISAEGTRTVSAYETAAYSVNTTAAFHEAVQLGIVDAAHKVKAIVAGGSEGAPNK
jgi:hypothetical protein